MEMRDKSIRTEADAEAAVDLPMLVAIPWVGETSEATANGKGKFWTKKKPDEHPESVGV
jgi:hypothetical protein